MHYPLATTISAAGATETPVGVPTDPAHPRRRLDRTVPVRRLDSLDEVHAAALNAARAGAAVAVIRNTVDEAIASAEALRSGFSDTTLSHLQNSGGVRNFCR
jgi:CRISPR-associated endonuclease/helicase Cas3